MKKMLFIFLILAGGCYLCYHYIFLTTELSATAYNNTINVLDGEYFVFKDDNVYHRGYFTLNPGNSFSINKEVPNTEGVKVRFKAKNSVSEESLLRWVYFLDDEDNVSVEFDDTQHAPENEEDSLHFIFQDPEMSILLPDAQSENYLTNLQTKLSLAAELRASLKRQMWFDETFKNPDTDYPFMLAYLEDDNGYSQLGVRVSGLFRELTIKGGEFPLRPGDIITHMYQPVYNGADLYAQLFDFATDRTKGVEALLTLQIIRDGKAYSIQSPYFFNEAYAPHLSDTKWDAATAGLLHSMFYGKASAVVAGTKKVTAWLKNTFNGTEDELPDYDEEAWLVTQREYRLRQKYSKAFGYGSFAGLWVSPAQGLSKSTARLITKTGIPRFGSRILASTLIESAEGAYYMYNDAPVLATKDEKWDAAISSIPESMGIGLVIGTIFTR